MVVLPRTVVVVGGGLWWRRAAAGGGCFGARLVGRWFPLLCVLEGGDPGHPTCHEENARCTGPSGYNPSGRRGVLLPLQVLTTKKRTKTSQAESGGEWGGESGQLSGSHEDEPVLIRSWVPLVGVCYPPADPRAL